MLEALDRLERHGAQIINMSLAGPSDNLVHDRIADLSMRKGVVFIAAAGNGGPGAPPGYPAAYKEVIAVTAIDDRKHSYDYANRGRYIDVAAPGVRIWTALPDNKEGMLNGTSFAAPFVTAIAAVTYNSTSLRAELREGRAPLDPKGAMLAAFAIEKLGSGERNDQYGLGLVKAPSTCRPAPPPAVTAVEESPAAEAPWQGKSGGLSHIDDRMPEGAPVTAAIETWTEPEPRPPIATQTERAGPGRHRKDRAAWAAFDRSSAAEVRGCQPRQARSNLRYNGDGTVQCRAVLLILTCNCHRPAPAQGLPCQRFPMSLASSSRPSIPPALRSALAAARTPDASSPEE